MIGVIMAVLKKASAFLLPDTSEADADAAAVWKARVDLAAAYRILDRWNLNEGIDNHLTLMVPGNRFLVIAYGLLWSEVTPENLLLLDVEGNILEGKGEAEITATMIHSRFHVARPELTALFHTHMPGCTALCVVEGGKLETCSQTSLKFHETVTYDEEYNGLVTDAEEGDRLATKLSGNKRILFHRHHGIMVAARSVAEAVDDIYYLERAAQLQVLAMSTGKPLALVKGADEITKQFRPGSDGAGNAEKHFMALKRSLNDPRYGESLQL